MIRWLRRLRWPLRDPAVREARDDYRDALAALRAQDEAEIQLLRGENARLRAALATVQVQSWMHSRALTEDRTRRAEAAREQRLADISTDATAVYATEILRRLR